MSPSTANLDYQGTTRRTMGMDLKKSEFEDFMNAYRPNLDLSRREQKSSTSSFTSEDQKVDLGRSIKKLMKRAQHSPSTLHKNRREGFQRTSETHDREWSLSNELKPPPVPSQEKKARRPYSIHFDGSGYSTPSHDGRPRIDASPVRSLPEHNPGPHLPKNGRPKTERSSAARELEQQQQSKQKTSEAPAQPKNGSKSKAAEKPPVAREEPQIRVKLHAEAATIPTITLGPAPSPLNTKKRIPARDERKAPVKDEKRAPVKDESRKSSGTESKIIPASEHSSVHCLVVSMDRIDRYLPPKHNPDPLLSLRIIEVPERKYHIILEFQESPTYERPKSSPSGLLVIDDDDDIICSRDQRAAFEWVRQSRLATSGILLINVEKISDFPFVTYLVVSGNRSELCNKMAYLKNKPSPGQRQQLNFLAGYEEAVTVVRPPVPQVPEQPTSDNAGFVVSLYQVNPGEDGGRFEQNWVTWTGARQLYSHVPECFGLKRISIHKSILPTKIINYVLICEFSSIMDYLTEACVLIDRLRARCCGFIGIYRVLDML